MIEFLIVIFKGLDHSRFLVYEHCKKLLLNLLIIMSAHNDHLTIARILLNNNTRQLGYGLIPPTLPVIAGSFTGKNTIRDKQIVIVAFSHDYFNKHAFQTMILILKTLVRLVYLDG